MLLTRFVRIQLIIFTLLTIFAVTVLCIYYLRLPSLVGVGHYTLHAQLPASGGLYATANVTYGGVTVGRVTDVQPVGRGVVASMSIDNRYEIPANVSANVHSVSAVGEQYLDLVDPDPGLPTNDFLRPGQTITTGTVPAEVGPILDATNKGLSALPKDQISKLLKESSLAVGGLGPALHRLADSTQLIVGDFDANIDSINDIIDNSGPILDSQIRSSDDIDRWAANLSTLAAQSAQKDDTVRHLLTEAVPTIEAARAVITDVRDSLPQLLANSAIVLDMLKRYDNGLEQFLVILPQGAAVAQTVLAPYPGTVGLNFNLTINQPPACLTGFEPPGNWRSPADTTTAPLPTDIRYCKIPKGAPNVVRGARNYPCADVPGKRAATPNECRSNEPYVPLGTNPWYGDPNQVLDCPAPAARCTRPVEPGLVIPAPTINIGMNPMPADQLPPPEPVRSDPLTPPSQGTVQCDGRQPNPCSYTPSLQATGVYSPASGEVVGPDGVRYRVENTLPDVDNGWKDMLAPAGS
jgi:phospholipid/cholesterol/gamma-HCH transport system substrate-binding protein